MKPKKLPGYKLKVRQNFTVEIRTMNLLKGIAKENHKSMSDLVDYAVQKTFQDPVKILDEEIKQCAIKINELQDKRTALLKLREEKEHDGDTE